MCLFILVPWTVENLVVTGVKSREISLSWQSPSDSYRVEMYELRYWIRSHHHNATVIRTKMESYSLTRLQQSTEYGFQVRAKTTHGWGEYTKPQYSTTGHMVEYVGEDEKNTQVRIIAGATVAVVVLLAIIIVMIVLFFRR